MRKILSAFALSVVALGVAGCSGSPLSYPQGETVSSSSQDEIPLTREMVYEGTLQKMPEASADGTHRLLLPDGSFVALQSSLENLDDFVGENVRVSGSVRPAIAGAGQSMRVSRVELILEAGGSSSSSSSGGTLSVSSSESSQSNASSAPVSSSSSLSSRAKSSSVASSSKSSVSSLSSVGSATSSTPVATMKSVKPDAAAWTRQYCSPQAGFCFPVHKNWWFKSFNTTASALWHVEVSDKEVDTLGTGPLSVDLTSGPLPTGVSDGAVVAQGDSVTGYRLWTGGKHFEVRGPASLQSAIAYIVQNITTYEPPAP